MGIENVNNAEFKAKVQEMLKDGKVTFEEVQGLTEAEKEQLQKLLGAKVPDQPGEVFTKKEEPKAPDNRSALEKTWDEVKTPLAVLGGGIAAGAAIGSIVPGLGTGIGAVVGGLFALTVGLTSCSSGDDFDEVIPGNTTIINNNITINANSSLQEVIDYLKTLNLNLSNAVELLKSVQSDTTAMKAGIEKLFLALVEMGAKIDELYAAMDIKGDTIINLLKEGNSKSDEILEVMAQGNGEIKALLNQILSAVQAGNQIGTNNGNILNEILDKMKGLGDNADVLAMLKELLAKVTEGVEQNKDMDTKTHQLLQSILENIQNLNGDMKNGIMAILAKIDDVSDKNYQLLINILNKIDEAKNDDKYMAILNAILAKLEESIQNGKDMDSKIYTILGDILNNVQNFNADMKTAVEKILAKLDQMSAENKTFFTAVLAKMDQMSDKTQKSLAAILNAINNNTAVAKGTQALVVELLNNLGKLGDKADAILEAISNIGVGGSIDLSTIEQMLADILAQSKANGDVLTSIDSKLNFVAVTLEGLRDQIGDNNKAILEQILAKIPDGCHCDGNLTIIIEKLETIIEKIKSDPEGNHEGILDDLNDYLG